MQSKEKKKKLTCIVCWTLVAIRFAVDVMTRDFSIGFKPGLYEGE